MKRLNEDKSYTFMQGHWIIELPELSALKNTKTNEVVKAFLSRQKDTYRTPYDRYLRDRKRQCVFGGTSNNLSFLPFDRTGNRRFLPVLTDPDQAEVHILDDEEASRAYMDQMWAEMMTLYRKGECYLKLPEEIEKQLLVLQKEYMPEDTLPGIIQNFLDNYGDDFVCTALILEKALGKDPKQTKTYEGREVNEIMNTAITGWSKYKQHRFPGYGQQRAWKRDAVKEEFGATDGFRPVPEQMSIPFEDTV